MKKVICKICGKEFVIHNWRQGIAKYCSVDCYNKGRTTKNNVRKPRFCKSCGMSFLPTNWYQKHCNRECFIMSIKKRTKKTCLHCGKEFRQIRKGQKYCSRECGVPYRDIYVKKPKNENMDILWSKIIKLKANMKCEYCGKETGLNSHHIFSRSNRHTRWEVDNGVCVCVGHHIFGLISAHKAPIEFIEWLKEKRGQEWYDRLRQKSNETTKLTQEDKDKIKEGLRQMAIDYTLRTSEMLKSKNI